jgi:hypothetical protein
MDPLESMFNLLLATQSPWCQEKANGSPLSMMLNGPYCSTEYARWAESEYDVIHTLDRTTVLLIEMAGWKAMAMIGRAA